MTEFPPKNAQTGPAQPDRPREIVRRTTNNSATTEPGMIGAPLVDTPTRHNRLPLVAAGAGAAVLATTAFLGARAVLSSDGDANTGADNGHTETVGAGSPTAPNLVTPDGKIVVIPGVTDTPTPTVTTEGTPSSDGGTSKGPGPVETPTRTVPTATPTEAKPTSTPTEVRPTATPTKETVAEVPCIVLPEKYCTQAELVQWTDAQGKNWSGLGFDLPAGVELYSPMKGQAPKSEFAQPNQYKGLKALVFDPNNPTLSYTFMGDINFPNMNTTNVEPGTLLGKTADTGIKNFDKYNLVIMITAIDPATKAPKSDEARMKELFPKAFTQPSRKVSYDGPSKPTTSVGGPIFVDGSIK